MAATLVIRQLTADAEADRILDRLESATGLHGERLEGARTYSLEESRDFVVAMASITAQLDGISDAWATHLRIDVEP